MRCKALHYRSALVLSLVLLATSVQVKGGEVIYVSLQKRVPSNLDKGA